MIDHERQLMTSSLTKLHDALTLLNHIRLPLSANPQWRQASLETAKKLLEELASGLEKIRDTDAKLTAPSPGSRELSSDLG